MLECAAEHELLLHQLPADALAAVFQRLHADDLERLSFVPSHAIASFVQADSVWNPVMCSVFGNALAAAVARSSCDGVQASETVNRGIPDLIPIWLSEAMPHSSVEQKAWIQCCDEWKRRPTLRTGYRILMRLIPASLLSSSSFAGWVVKLTSDETTQEAKASVISEFIHLNARIWASNRDNGGECPCAIVAGALTEYLTTPLADPSAELAKAACRAYVCTFQLRGLDLVPALRVFLHQTRMPKEGRRMCRLLWGFAGHFFAQNGGFTPETPRELIKVLPNPVPRLWVLLVYSACTHLRPPPPNSTHA